MTPKVRECHKMSKKRKNQATFRAKLDTSGRITIPKSVRESLQLEKGSSIVDITLNVVVRDK